MLLTRRRQNLTRRDEILRKIMSRVEITSAPDHMPAESGPCFIWTGPTSGEGRGGGYPRMNLDGATVAVHKVAWVNDNGHVPPRKQLDHLCWRRLCVNSKHIEMTTHKQNQRRKSMAQRTVECRTE